MRALLKKHLKALVSNALLEQTVAVKTYIYKYTTKYARERARVTQQHGIGSELSRIVSRSSDSQENFR